MMVTIRQGVQQVGASAVLLAGLINVVVTFGVGTVEATANTAATAAGDDETQAQANSARQGVVSTAAEECPGESGIEYIFCDGFESADTSAWSNDSYDCSDLFEIPAAITE